MRQIKIVNLEGEEIFIMNIDIVKQNVTVSFMGINVDFNVKALKFQKIEANVF